MTEIRIGERVIGPAHDPFVIAEVGINHNGSLETALEMVRVAKRAGADAVKFQTFKASEFVNDATQTYTYTSQGKQVTESMLAMFERHEFSRDEWFRIKQFCVETGIRFLSTPQNVSDLELLLEIGVDAVKVGSDDFTNIPLLKRYAQTKLPLLLSCGMADLAEVYQSLDCVGAHDGAAVVLLLCTSQYPTPPRDVNALKLTTLRAAFPSLVLGFSDHSQGPVASTVAAALGASVFEKHFTLGNDLPGPDHWFSENPESLEVWIDSIRTAKTVLGSALVRPTTTELEMRKLVRRSVAALRDIPAGAKIEPEMVGLRRPGTELAPAFMELVIGRTAAKAIKAGTLLKIGDFF